MRATAAAAVLVLVAAVAGLLVHDDGKPNQRVAAGGSPETTVTEPASTTTAPAPATTAAPTVVTTATTAKPTTTTTTFPANAARVTVVNNYPKAVEVHMDNVRVTVATGQRAGSLAVVPAADNDVVEVMVHDDPTCGVGDAGRYFEAGRAYQLTVSAQDHGGCGTKGTQGVAYSITAG
jgi:hypothetical protein